MKSLENKVAIVTGAASGIGKAAAVLLAKEGAKIVLSDIDEKQGREAAEEIIAIGSEAVFVQADVSKPEDNKLLVEHTLTHLDRKSTRLNSSHVKISYAVFCLKKKKKKKIEEDIQEKIAR